MTKKANVIFFDIETSPIETRTWTLYPKAISHDSIIQDWTIICAAWKGLGRKTVYTAQIDKPYKDKQVCLKLRNALAEADAIAGHNSDKFDVKKLNTRLIFHGIDPLPPVHQIDTLKMVRKVAAFSSNRLDYLSKQLTGKGKIHVDYNLWLEVMKGDKKALKQMVDYNVTDVLRLEEVYLKLLPYSKGGHPNIGAIEGKGKKACSTCGSNHIKHNGIRYTAAGNPRQEIKCLDCHHYGSILL